MNNTRPLFQSTYPIKWLLLSVLTLSQIPVNSQNYLMTERQNGYHAGVQLAYNTFENYYAVLPGFTFAGRLTVGFDLGKIKDLVNGINSTVLRPNVSYLMLKQNNSGLPISFDLNAGYQFNYVSEVAFNSRSVQFGLGIHHEIRPLENVKIIPAFLMEANKSTTGINPRFDASVFLSYGFQTSIVWNNYYLIPKYIIFDDVSTISVKLGMIFSNIPDAED